MSYEASESLNNWLDKLSFQNAPAHDVERLFHVARASIKLREAAENADRERVSDYKADCFREACYEWDVAALGRSPAAP